MPESSSTPDTSPDWLVLGSGAMACLWSGSLLSAGRAVHMHPRVPPPVEAYHALRVTSESAAEEFGLRVEAADADTALHRVLVCTKAGDVVAALGSIRRRIAPEAAVVLLQNGMGFQQEAAALLPRARIFAAVTTEGAWLEGPFRVRHAGRGTTLLGRWGGGDDAGAIATDMGCGFLEVTATDTIDAELWRKLAINCAINPLTALHDCTNGGLLDQPRLRREFAALCTEISAVLAALGHVEVAAGVTESATRVARATARNRSSMLQDLRAGRRTEIDWITGYLCSAAQEAGIACPANEALLAAVRAREPH